MNNQNTDARDFHNLACKGKIERGTEPGKFVWKVTKKEIEELGNNLIIGLWNYNFPDEKIFIDHIHHRTTGEIKIIDYDNSKKVKRD